jgi:hypothetical protein
LVEIEAHEKFYRRHMVDIPRIKFFAQQRYRANWPFLDGHYKADACRQDVAAAREAGRRRYEKANP